MIVFTFSLDPMTGRFDYAGSPGLTLAKAHAMLQDALVESLQPKQESGSMVIKPKQPKQEVKDGVQH